MQITVEVSDEVLERSLSMREASQHLMLTGYIWPAVILGEVAKEIDKINEFKTRVKGRN